MATNQIADEYEKVVAQYEGALNLLHKGQFAEAKTAFEAIEKASGEEASLADRARVYASVCARKLTDAPPDPTSAEDCYQLAVMRCNAGDFDMAIRLLNQALQSNPGSDKCLFARASAFSLKGNPEAAIADLRQAIAIDPQLRFQAVNDSDFEPLREEPGFIDIIEPTPAGS